MRVSDYLGYLRDMSRKIAFRGGFEACLIRPAVAGVPALHGASAGAYAGLTRETWLAQARQRIDAEENQGVYVGYGLIAGKVTIEGRSREVAGPLIIMPVDMEPDGEVSTDLEFEHEDTLINYDLLALLIPGADSVPDGAAPAEHAVLFTQELLRAISEAEAFVESATANGLPGDPASLVRAVYGILAAQIPVLAKFPLCERVCPAPTPLRHLAGSANGEAINCQFLFIAVRPSEVTTYQALTKLIRQTEGVNGGEGVENPVLAKLLTSSIEQTGISLVRDEAFRRSIHDDLIPLIPLSLSEPQKQAIADAWASEISYVQGPPGTGKSHTITAMILSAVLLGKKVLLVSNKKAALDVVREKVEKLLGPGSLSLAVGDPEGRRQQKALIEEVIARADNVRAAEDFKELKRRVEAFRAQIQQKLAEIYAQEDAIEMYLGGATKAEEALVAFCQARDYYVENYRLADLQAVGMHGRTSVDSAFVQAVERIARTVEEARAGGQGLPRTKALRVRALLGFTANELSGGWLRTIDRPVDALRRIDAYVKALRAAHDLARMEGRLDRQIGEIRKLAETKRREHESLCAQLAKAQLEMIRLAKAAEHLGDLQRFKQVFFFRKPSRLKSIFATTKVANALTALPLWAAEIKDLSAVFPFELGLFDLVVVDEASQVNIAELIPAFYRGTRFCVVGDDRQLGLGAAGLFALNRNFERLAWERHCSGVPYETAKTRSILVTEHSILDLILRSPYSAQLPQVMLDEHFRSRPTLAAFTSEEFYSDGGGLKVMTETARNLGKGSFRAIITGGARRGNQGIVDAEVDKVVEVLVSMEDGSAYAAGGVLEGQSPAGRVLSVGVVSFTRDQVLEIREKTLGRFKTLELIVGTPEELQGNERDVILLTFGLGAGTRYAKGHYENPNRFNVATSRARLFTIAILGEEPRTAERLKRYLNLNDSTQGAFSLPAFKPDRVVGEARKFLAAELERYAQNRGMRVGGAGFTLHAGIKACGQESMDFVLINHVGGKGVHVEMDGAPGYPLSKHYPSVQRERVAVLGRAGYGIIHLRHADLYEGGWLKSGAGLEAFRVRLDAELDAYLLLRQS
jgi:hypothetical protein